MPLFEFAWTGKGWVVTFLHPGCYYDGDEYGCTAGWYSTPVVAYIRTPYP